MQTAVKQNKEGLQAPLPIKDGITPSRVWLPDGSWSTMGQFLIERFAFVAETDLLRRLEQGQIVDSNGTPIQANSPYQSTQWLWYYRQVDNEVSVPFDMPILYVDDNLIVVDKPHFLATIPGGQYLKHTALARLRRDFNEADICPLHRLDRETAGVLLFCRQPDLRGAYQTLFQSQRIDKVYEAIAPANPNQLFPLQYSSRLEAPEGQFLVQETQGEPNSQTVISVLASWHDNQHGDLSWYQLQPITGRKHQLRVHLYALGTPMLNDSYYPTGQPYVAFDDFSRPLQLLARSIGFVDPITQEYRQFHSQQQLAHLPSHLLADSLVPTSITNNDANNS